MRTAPALSNKPPNDYGKKRNQATVRWKRPQRKESPLKQNWARMLAVITVMEPVSALNNVTLQMDMACVKKPQIPK